MNFAYSSDQWGRIKSTLPEGYAQRFMAGSDETSISGIVRGMLEGYAVSYLPDEHPHVDWAEIHRMAVDLRDMLKPVAEVEAREGVIEVEEEGRHERFEPTTVRQTVRALDRLIGEADLAKWIDVEWAEQDRERLGGARPQDVQRLSFYDNVLDLWRIMGGKISVTYVEKTDTHEGPLVEYLAAVTGPVMGEKAPARSSMTRIVRQYKARRKYRRDHPLF
jgi:hypothetical protein